MGTDSRHHHALGQLAADAALDPPPIHRLKTFSRKMSVDVKAGMNTRQDGQGFKRGRNGCRRVRDDAMRARGLAGRVGLKRFEGACKRRLAIDELAAEL